MSPSYVGSVWMFGGNFAPQNFHYCDGSLQSIANNEVLYTLLGTTYGGDGINTFGLPDLRGRAIVGQGNGPGIGNYVNGQMAGTENVTLTTQNLASHTHLLSAGATATQATPASNLYVSGVMDGTSTANFYLSSGTFTQLTPSTIGVTGGSQPLNIQQPYLTISYIIALYGIYPSQN